MHDPTTTLDNEQVLAILALSKDATAIFSTEDLNIRFANDAMLSYWGKSKDVIGINLGEAMPELEGLVFLDILKSVWISGETYESKTLAARVFEDGILQTRYFDFTHRALQNSDKITYAILTTATEISDGQITADLVKSNRKTEKKLHQQLFDANQEYKTTTEELHLSNNELFRLRKEVEAANQLLKLANRGLKEDNTRLTASERKALEIFSGAPIAIGVLTGREMLIETANLMLLEIWGAPLTVIGKKLSTAIPELTGQRFLKLLDTVFATGKAFYSANEVLFLKRNGKMSEGYYNFVYHPLKNEFGETESIMLVANEVTERVRATQLVQTLNGDLAEINKELRMINEQVNSANEKAESSNNQLNLANEELVASRKEVAESGLSLRQSIEAANFGTWSLNTQTGEFVTSKRLKELFGFLATDDPTLAECVSRISPEHQSFVRNEIDMAITQGGLYDLSYSLGSPDGKNIRWVRAVGNLTLDSNGEIETFAGVVLDTTSQKQEEQLRNDFISMVSHELKTPLTSLMAYIQMLQIVLKTATDERVLDMLKRSRNQVTKMNKMITGFLDVSRFDGGKLYLQASDFSLKQLITDIIDDVVLTSSTHNIIFEANDDIIVSADRDKIGQVVQNLLSNALKYSPHGKNIDLFYRITAKMVTVSLRDYGIGVKAEDLDKLFERFYRIQNNQTNTIAGFGIGLYLCSEIIKQHKGKIWIESDGENGSLFNFSIPIARF